MFASDSSSSARVATLTARLSALAQPQPLILLRCVVRGSGFETRLSRHFSNRGPSRNQIHRRRCARRPVFGDLVGLLGLAASKHARHGRPSDRRQGAIDQRSFFG
jgi:hypothetical protein